MHCATVVSLLALVLLAGPAAAGTYRWVDAKGGVHYSDRPPQLEAVVGERDALIEEALTLSGGRRTIESLPAQVRAGAEASQSPLPAKERAAIAKIIAEAFRPGPILASVRTAFQRNYDAMQMGLALAQLRMPVVRKMTELEVAVNAADFGQKLRAFAAGLKDAPPPEDRVARLAQLDAISGATELMLDIRVSAVASTLKILSSLMPPDKRIAPAQAEVMARDLVSQQRDAARQEMLLIFLYAYRDATDQELDEYIAIEGSEPGRWLQGIYKKALLEALTAASEAAVRQVARSLAPTPR